MGNLLFIFIGFFASQRFLLPNVYHYSPVIPLIFAAFLLLKSPKQAGVFAMMSLFFISDLGGQYFDSTIPIYNSTNAEIKYAGYLTAILVLLRLLSSNIRMSSALLGFALAGLATTTTFVYSLDAGNLRDTSTAIRDILILVCIFACLFESRDEEFDIQPLYWASLGFLAGETMNLLLFFDRATHGYMSFASIKSFVIFPLFFRLNADKKFTPFSLLLIVPTLLVMLAYNSKMVFVSVVLAAVAVLVITLVRRPSYIGLALIGTIVLYGLLQVTLYLFPDVEANRIVSFFNELTKGNGFLLTIENLDPVRFQQHYLFFSRGVFEVVFGSGIGAGINDVNGQLSTVANETAFTAQEIRDGLFFNFHDIWIDFGLRFGVITLVFIALGLFKILSDPRTRIMGAVFIMILINATFSIAGIFMAVLFYKIVLQKPVKSNYATGKISSVRTTSASFFSISSGNRRKNRNPTRHRRNVHNFGSFHRTAKKPFLSHQTKQSNP